MNDSNDRGNPTSGGSGRLPEGLHGESEEQGLAWSAFEARRLAQAKGHYDTVSCEIYREDLYLVLGGDLEPGVMDLLVEHLANCDPCADQTAGAARTRDSLLEGLSFESEQWREPRLWPGIAAAMGMTADALVPRQNPDSRLRLVTRVSRVVAPLAVAAALLFFFRPWAPSQSSQPFDQTPGVSTDRSPAAGGTGTADSPGSAALLASSGSAAASAPDANLDPQADAMAGGLLVPLTDHDLQELRDAAPLRVEMRGGVIEILRGDDQRSTTLASFPRR